MFSEFKNKVVLITGAAGDIGNTILGEFRKHGARVYPTDLQKLDAMEFIQGDISDPEFIRHLVKQLMDREGRIDILVNNAGICPRTPVLDITREEWQKVMDINLTSMFFLSQSVLDIMINQQSGAIINLASLAGKVGGITVGAHYSASKAAIECITKTMAKTGAPYGVRINAVAPGIIDTAMQDGNTPEQMDQYYRSIPLKRMGTSLEVASMILVLASNLASYTTGSTIDVNGGLFM